MVYHLEALENAMDRIAPNLRAQLVLSNGMARANRKHLEILKACEDRDVACAADLTHRHIGDAR